jgi:hypothetical protein
MTDTTQTQAVAVRERADLMNTQPMLDSQKFEHFQRASKALMHSSILNPSIRGSSPEQCFSNLMLIFDLSDRWKLPAVSIAQGIAIVHDKIVYEGKLITAMLQASLGVHLQYWWTGERGTPDYRIYVSDRPFSELADPDATPAEQMDAINSLLRPGVQIPGWRIVDGSVADWRTYQKDGRTPNPAWTGTASQNQLSYRGAREWARRYESAQMLGVYGDDEMEVLTARVVDSRGSVPTLAGGLTGGFTRPAEPIEDAEIQEVDVADVLAAKADHDAKSDKGPEKPAETKQPVEDAKPASTRRKAQAKPADAKPKDPEPQEVVEALMPTTDDLANAYTDGYQGTPLVIETHWSPAFAEAMRADWQRGADDGTAAMTSGSEASDDATDPVDSDFEGDGADDDDAGTFDQEQVEATKPVTALEALMLGLGERTSWADLKAGLSETAKSADWKAATVEQQDVVRAQVWARMRQLVEAGQTEPLDVATDLTAFRCWVALEEDIEAIQGTWQHLVHQTVYTGLKPDQQASLERATLARVQDLTE